MNCTEVKENLGVFADREADKTLKRSIRSHLENCAGCGDKLADLKKISAAVKHSAGASAPAFLDEKVLNAYRDHHLKKEVSGEIKRAGWFGIPKFTFAGGLIILAIFSALSFQLGRVSASANETRLAGSRGIPKANEKTKDTAAVKAADRTKIVEVPVIEEKIVRVPVVEIREVVKTVYLKQEKIGSYQQSRPGAANKLSGDQTARSGFRPAGDLNPQVVNKNDADQEYKIAPDLNPTVINKGETDE
ncbi:MAG: zf-HC2 domain-containing protein [Pyrinomonadaceae bacterium]